MSVRGKDSVRAWSGNGLRLNEPVDLRELKGEARRRAVEKAFSYCDFTIDDGTQVMGTFLRHGYKNAFLDREVEALSTQEGRVCLGKYCMGDEYKRRGDFGYDLVERPEFLAFLYKHERKGTACLRKMILPWVSREACEREDGLVERLALWMISWVEKEGTTRSLNFAQGMAFGRLVEMCKEGHLGCAQKLCAQAACMADMALGWGRARGTQLAGRPRFSDLTYLLTLAFGGEVVGSVDFVMADRSYSSSMTEDAWNYQLTKLYTGELQELPFKTFSCDWHSLEIGFGNPRELWYVGQRVCLLNMACVKNQNRDWLKRSIFHTRRQIEHFKKKHKVEELEPRWLHELKLIERVLKCLEEYRAFRVERLEEFPVEEEVSEAATTSTSDVSEVAETDELSDEQKRMVILDKLREVAKESIWNMVTNDDYVGTRNNRSKLSAMRMDGVVVYKEIWDEIRRLKFKKGWEWVDVVGIDG